MAFQKFDVAKLEKLNDPGRFESMKPLVMWEALGSPSPRVIVDIGAGTGLFSAKWAELAPQAIVYAVDTEPAMSRWMSANRREVAEGRIVVVEGEETGVPLEDGSADLVTMLNLHHELAEPDLLYLEALRLLRPGGQVLVVDWDRTETPKGPPARIRIDAEEAAAFLASAGFVHVTAHEGLEWHWLLTAARP